MDYYEIGQRIRKVRKAHGLSQEELAGMVDISTTHMSHIETGNTKLSLPVLVSLAGALGVRTDDLLNQPGGYTTSTAVETPSAARFTARKVTSCLRLTRSFWAKVHFLLRIRLLPSPAQ